MKIPPLPVKPGTSHLHKGPKRYRLMFINENTFNTVWSLKLSRLKVWLLSAAVIAGIVCIVATIMVATPLSSLLPGYMKPQERHEQIIAGLRIDSIAAIMDINNAYIANLSAILNDDIDVDSVAMYSEPVPAGDTLMAPTDGELRFARQWEERERYNLSVLTPVAAGSMVFHNPVPAAVSDTLVDNRWVMTVPRRATVQSMHSGTVVDVSYSTVEDGVVVIQIPNDFVVRYSGLDEVMAGRGDKVSGGHAIGVGKDTPRGITVEVWHKGTAVDPRTLLTF